MTNWALGMWLVAGSWAPPIGDFADVRVHLPDDVEPRVVVVTVDGRRVHTGRGHDLRLRCVPRDARVRVAVGRETLAESGVTDFTPYRPAFADVVQIAVEDSDGCSRPGDPVVGFVISDPHGFVVAQGLMAHQTPTLMVDGVIVGRVEIARPSGFGRSFGGYVTPQRLGVLPPGDQRHIPGW